MEFEKSNAVPEIEKSSNDVSLIFSQSTLAQIKDLGTNQNQSKSESLPGLELVGSASSEKKIAALKETDLGTHDKPMMEVSNAKVNLPIVGKVDFPPEANVGAAVNFKLVPESNGSGQGCLIAKAGGNSWILRDKGWKRIENKR